MQNLGLLAPEIALSLLGLGLMLADLLIPARASKLLYHLAWLAAAAALGLIAYGLSVSRCAWRPAAAASGWSIR